MHKFSTWVVLSHGRLLVLISAKYLLLQNITSIDFHKKIVLKGIFPMGSLSTPMRPTANMFIIFFFDKKWLASCHASKHF